mmetsp:Transcript_134200/g.218447  ORF Transcript_134200/g.218447 Transcript_134200/m.218447 type:complete len:570 (-) Transcript_134200:468-2177(-)
MAPRRCGSKRSQQEVARTIEETKMLGAGQPQQKARVAKSRRSLDAPGRSGKKMEVKLQMLHISQGQLLAAVESLYADELKPVGRILRKRISELCPRMGGNGTAGTTPDISAEELRKLCVANPSLAIEAEEGGDFSVFMVEGEQSFVDIYSTCDSYSSEMWSGLQAYCESSCGQEMSLPGGRYACAQAISALGLPCLAGYSLGRMCHIVQLAITQKKILGYLHGAVVAYSNSQSKVKEQLASQGNPLTTTGQGEDMLRVASLREAQDCVLQILRNASGKVPLSNVKRFFREKFELELSETSLGQAKLSELLNSDHFKGICAVELQETGYVVVERTSEHFGTGAQQVEPGQSPHEVVHNAEKLGGRTSRQSTTASSGSSSDVDLYESELSSAEEQDYDAPSGKLMLSSMSSWVDEPLHFEDPDDMAECEPLHDTDTVTTFCPFTPGMLAKEGCKVQNTFFHVAPPLPTPVRTGAMHRSKSVPKDVGGAKLESRPASPIMQSPPLASPAVYWPSTPAEPDVSQNSFSWVPPQLDAFGPPLVAPTVQFLQIPAPVATHHSILYMQQICVPVVM